MERVTGHSALFFQEFHSVSAKAFPECVSIIRNRHLEVKGVTTCPCQESPGKPILNRESDPDSVMSPGRSTLAVFLSRPAIPANPVSVYPIDKILYITSVIWFNKAENWLLFS